MQKALTVSGVVLLVIGIALQYGPWLMAWMSRLLGWHTPAATYEEFVDRVAAAISQGHGFARIVMPWALMALGLILVVASRRFSGQRS